MTDIHCHILPHVDDGSKSWEMTIEMCRLAQADGIEHIVATPHASHRYRYSREQHADSLAVLCDKVPELQFSLGCDFHLSHENTEDAVHHPERYVIGDTRYMLVEFSDFQTPHQMRESLFRLHSAGVITIITHPERNPVIDQYPDLPQEFFDMGSAIQITAGSLCGDWGQSPKTTCKSLLKKRLVSIIASDAHEQKHRVPVLSRACRAAGKIVGAVAANLLVRGNPGAVVSNQLLA